MVRRLDFMALALFLLWMTTPGPALAQAELPRPCDDEAGSALPDRICADEDLRGHAESIQAQFDRLRHLAPDPESVAEHYSQWLDRLRAAPEPERVLLDAYSTLIAAEREFNLIQGPILESMLIGEVCVPTAFQLLNGYGCDVGDQARLPVLNSDEIHDSYLARTQIYSDWQGGDEPGEGDPVVLEDRVHLVLEGVTSDGYRPLFAEIGPAADHPSRQVTTPAGVAIVSRATSGQVALVAGSGFRHFHSDQLVEALTRRLGSGEIVDEVQVDFQTMQGEAFVRSANASFGDDGGIVPFGAAFGSERLEVVSVTFDSDLPVDPGLQFVFGDWVVACDERNTCRALGLPPETGELGAFLLITRGHADREASVDLFVAPQPDASPPDGLAVSIMGRTGEVHGLTWPFSVPVDDGGLLAARPPPEELAAVIDALLAGNMLEIEWGDLSRSVSLDGSSAALLRLDDLQARLQSDAALVPRPGPLRAWTPVEPLPTASVLPDETLEMLVPPPPPPTELEQAADPTCDGVDPLAIRMSGGRVLWGLCELAGNTNIQYRFWIEEASGLRPVRFDRLRSNKRLIPS